MSEPRSMIPPQLMNRLLVRDLFEQERLRRALSCIKAVLFDCFSTSATAVESGVRMRHP